MKLRNTIRGLFLLCVALATFLPFISLRAIVISHEGRVYQVARQMAESGWPWNHSNIDIPIPGWVDTPEGKRLRSEVGGPTMSVNPWLVPVLNGGIRLQKPPLPYWCSAVMFKLFGLGEGMSRLTPAILGAISVLLIWDLARKLLGSVGGWYAGLIWFSSYFIVDEFRKSMADPYLAFTALVATWAWIRATRSTWPGVWVVLSYVIAGLSILAKGPLILLFAIVYIAAYHICYRKSLPNGWKNHAVGIALFVLIAAPWYVIIWQNIPHAINLWGYESFGEFGENAEKVRPWWFYLPNLLQITLPWTPLWIMGLIEPFKYRKRRRWFALVCTIAIVLVFSLSNVKKNAYLLPLVPIQTLLAGQGLVWLTAIFRKYKKQPVAFPMLRLTVIALVFAILIQIFVSIFLTMQDNNRSAKDAARLVERMMEDSPDTSLLVSRLPEEASVYLTHLDYRDSKDSKTVLLIADDSHKGHAKEMADDISSTIAGPVVSREEIPIPNSRGPRWKVFKLTIGSSPASGPAPSQPDIPAPATSSSGSPASRGSS